MVHDEVRLSVITECNSSGMCKTQWQREHQIEEKRDSITDYPKRLLFL